MMYVVRFWNEADENILFDFGPCLCFDSEEEAFNGAEAFLPKATKAGAVEMSINDDFYDIWLDDDDDEDEEEEEEYHETPDDNWWIDSQMEEMIINNYGWD